MAHHTTAASVTQPQLRCDTCNLNFTRADNLQRHMRKYHLGDKPGSNIIKSEKSTLIARIDRLFLGYHVLLLSETCKGLK